MIGGAGALFLLVNGRVMGASGILGSLVDGSAGGTRGEKLAFLAGLVLVPPLLVPLYDVVDTRLTQNPWLLVIAGLLTDESSRTVDRVPALGELPVLGGLFRSSAFRDRKTELVVFVTPRYAEPDRPGAIPAPQRSVDDTRAGFEQARDRIRMAE